MSYGNSPYGGSTAYGSSYETKPPRTPKLPPLPKPEKLVLNPTPSEEITEFLTNWDDEREMVTDYLTREHNLEGDTFVVTIARSKPDNLAAQVPGFETTKSLCIQENPMGRRLNEEEMAYLRSTLVKGDSIDQRTNEDFIVIRSARLSGYKAWISYVDSEYKEEHPQELLLAKDGHKVFKLNTANEIRTEGRLLKHCVGNQGMGYITKSMQGNITLLSVREEDDKPLYTVEIRGENVVQAKGYNNAEAPGFVRDLARDAI